MKNHVWRPVYVAIGLIVAALAARFFLVPNDFGAADRNYIYGYHRLGSEQEWRAQPVRYAGTGTCGECHPQAECLSSSPHAPIACENCHGPAGDHPRSPPLLAIDTDGSLCLRCHARYAYTAGGRDPLPDIDPLAHYPGARCSGCHDPHQPQRQVTP